MMQCKSCGKRYDIKKSEQCPKCGAFNMNDYANDRHSTYSGKSAHEQVSREREAMNRPRSPMRERNSPRINGVHVDMKGKGGKMSVVRAVMIFIVAVWALNLISGLVSCVAFNTVKSSTHEEAVEVEVYEESTGSNEQAGEVLYRYGEHPGGNSKMIEVTSTAK